jgi:hypothetical protein
MEQKEKAQKILRELIVMTYDIHGWLDQKDCMRSIIQQHLNNSYMIDQRYYKDYVNLYHEILIQLNEL